MIVDTGNPVAHASNRWNKPVILCVLLFLFGGCDSGGDRLSELVPKFSPQREDLNDARQLIQVLAATEGISGLHVGALYNNTPDRVWTRRDSPPEPLEAISLKDPKSKATLERLRAVARKLSCAAVIVDELGRVRVIIRYERNFDYGYVFFERSDAQQPKDGDYLEIPGEKNWYAFSR